MLEALIDLAGTLVWGLVMFFLFGYFTSKISLYAVVTTGVVLVAYLLIPGLDAGRVLPTVGPPLVKLWGLYPMMATDMFPFVWDGFGFIGLVTAALVYVILFVPYAIGIALGLWTWPEVHIARLVL